MFKGHIFFGALFFRKEMDFQEWVDKNYAKNK